MFVTVPIQNLRFIQEVSLRPFHQVRWARCICEGLHGEDLVITGTLYFVDYAEATLPNDPISPILRNGMIVTSRCVNWTAIEESHNQVSMDRHPQ